MSHINVNVCVFVPASHSEVLSLKYGSLTLACYGLMLDLVLTRLGVKTGSETLCFQDNTSCFPCDRANKTGVLCLVRNVSFALVRHLFTEFFGN